MLLNINTSSVLVSLMQLFFAVGSICLTFVLGFRKFKKIRNIKTILLKEKCQTLIVGLLFDENSSPESTEMEVYFLKNKLRRQLFLEELMGLHKSLQGEIATSIEQYYILKEFDKLSSKNQGLRKTTKCYKALMN
jgi:RNase H-fold protein (predicted Holliday junction resolvase)